MKAFNKLLFILCVFTTISSLKSNNDLEKKAQPVPPITKAQQPQKATPVDTSSWPILVPIPPNMPMQAKIQVTQKLIEKLWKDTQKKLDTFSGVKRSGDDVTWPISMPEDMNKEIKRIVFEEINKQKLSKQSSDQLKRIFIRAFLSEYKVEGFYWCDCIPAPKRIKFIIDFVQDIKKKYPNYKQKLTYTSFASGSLLQDYLTIAELLETYENLNINIIDLLYPDIPSLAKTKSKKGKVFEKMSTTSSKHIINIIKQEEQADTITLFKAKLETLLIPKQTKDKKYSLNINIYNSAYELISKVKRNPALKTDILVMVDPDIGNFSVQPYPSLSNVLMFWLDSYIDAPVLTLYYPHYNNPMQLYEQTKAATQKNFTKLKNGLIQLIQQNTTNNTYSPKFLNQLLKNSIKVVPDTKEAEEKLEKKLQAFERITEKKYKNILNKELQTLEKKYKGAQLKKQQELAKRNNVKKLRELKTKIIKESAIQLKPKGKESKNKIFQQYFPNLTNNFKELSELKILEQQDPELYSKMVYEGQESIESSEESSEVVNESEESIEESFQEDEELNLADQVLYRPRRPMAIRINNVPVLVSWSTDPFVSFQDMVNTIVKNDSLIYTLDHQDRSVEEDTSKMIKINPSTYKNQDVITPLAGKWYQDYGYKKINLTSKISGIKKQTIKEPLQ